MSCSFQRRILCVPGPTAKILVPCARRAAAGLRCAVNGEELDERLNDASDLDPRFSGIEFRSEAWSTYFDANAIDRAETAWDTGTQVEPALREPLIYSLQRFQVGESGDGKHLRRGAVRAGDVDYHRAIPLFIAEEKEHSRLLASAIGGMGGWLLTHQWSDIAFGTTSRRRTDEDLRDVRGVKGNRNVLKQSVPGTGPC